MKISAGDGRKTPGALEIVVIGVSTGGPSALEVMLPGLPKDFPAPVLVVQHMPRLFTGSLAERLDRLCPLRVREASGGVEVKAGTIWITPGDAHMEIARGFNGLTVSLHQQAMLNSCRSSVDYLFRSAAEVVGAGTVAVVMTGMGADGLEGARAVRHAGGRVLVQDEASSAVWGMPGRVMQAGLAEAALGLDELAAGLMKRVVGQGQEEASVVSVERRQERFYGS
ncbi:CheB methylesterase domain-containing protein [Granulicella tundricola]|uniref:protein-glutamate methylesterase n=1 Tax=Granulicella tundricola (strain ATCC BAA-1859 / DSM 23138 / MP5ACTX9) TaxID=1198114 RepID=E8X305_GRATM|nr:CheB methylesterase domain-containing protein [Granulicella tundricola]ADW68139.1 CheB methylesterase [Granulicella tundricola MP5ACTX9]